MTSKPIGIQGGHVFIPVNDLDRALKFYRDVLGISVKRLMSEWMDLTPIMRLSLSREDEELIEFHVEDFEEAATSLEKAGVKVERRSRHHGRIIDPFGNVLGLHDHREREI